VSIQIKGISKNTTGIINVIASQKEIHKATFAVFFGAKVWGIVFLIEHMKLFSCQGLFAKGFQNIGAISFLLGRLTHPVEKY